MAILQLEDVYEALSKVSKTYIGRKIELVFNLFDNIFFDNSFRIEGCKCEQLMRYLNFQHQFPRCRHSVDWKRMTNWRNYNSTVEVKYLTRRIWKSSFHSCSNWHGQETCTQPYFHFTCISKRYSKRTGLGQLLETRFFMRNNAWEDSGCLGNVK